MRAAVRLIVIITSNAEKELPDALLGRCIFHYIQFSNPTQMKKIVQAHFENLDEALLEQILETFYKIRDMRNLEKKPGMSELLDWVHALTLSGISPEQIKERLPFAGILIKKDNDMKLIHENW